MPDGGDRPASEPVFVVTRRGLRRVLVVCGAVVVLAAVGGAAYVIGRTTSTRTTAMAQPAGSTLEEFTVASGAMEPAIGVGDRILVDPLTSSHPYPIRRGAIIVFRTPPKEDCGGSAVRDLVKRVIGLPGERIASSGNTVLIDGKPLAEPWLPAGEPLGKPIKSTIIPKHSYYVLGDNRPNSCDSRYWGPVARSLIVGKVVRILPGSATAPSTAPATTLLPSTSTTTTVPPTTTTAPPTTTTTTAAPGTLNPTPPAALLQALATPGTPASSSTGTYTATLDPNDSTWANYSFTPSPVSNLQGVGGFAEQINGSWQIMWEGTGDPCSGAVPDSVLAGFGITC
jgi:signal peptidase I